MHALETFFFNCPRAGDFAPSHIRVQRFYYQLRAWFMLCFRTS